MYSQDTYKNTPTFWVWSKNWVTVQTAVYFAFVRNLSLEWTNRPCFLFIRLWTEERNWFKCKWAFETELVISEGFRWRENSLRWTKLAEKINKSLLPKRKWTFYNRSQEGGKKKAVRDWMNGLHSKKPIPTPLPEYTSIKQRGHLNIWALLLPWREPCANRWVLSLLQPLIGTVPAQKNKSQQKEMENGGRRNLPFLVSERIGMG